MQGCEGMSRMPLVVEELVDNFALTSWAATYSQLMGLGANILSRTGMVVLRRGPAISWAEDVPVATTDWSYN